MQSHDVSQAIGDNVQGLVPGCPTPLAFPPFPCTDERELGSLIIVDEGKPGRSPGANGTVDPRRMGVALKKNALAVLHLDLNGTSNGAHPADAKHSLFRHDFLLPLSHQPLSSGGRVLNR
jgi:hypothetical protein